MATRYISGGGDTSFVKDFGRATWRCRATECAQWKADGCYGEKEKNSTSNCSNRWQN